MIGIIEYYLGSNRGCLKADRLNLRLIQPDDYELLARQYNDPSVRYQAKLMRDPSSVEDIEALVEEDNAAHFLPCRDETPVGHVMFSPIDMEVSNAELGYLIFPDEQENGYATETADLLLSHAFEMLGLHKVYATVSTGNEASMRVLEKLGSSRKAS